MATTRISAPPATGEAPRAGPIMWWLLLPILAVATLYTGYLVLLTAAAVVARLVHRRDSPGPPRHRFTVVIPAHNEGATLPATLASLAVLDYPRPQYEVVVVADNCDDDTWAVARARGARVLTRTDPARRGKGRALGWAFAHLLRENRHEAFVVMDADTRLAPDFLTRVDAALQRGAHVVQAYCTVANVGESWRTALMTADMALVYYLRPAGRQALGGSVELGNAFGVTPAVLRRVPWRAMSVGEDREYHAELLFHGIHPVFVPDAVAYTLMEPTMATAREQELRWEGGRFALARRCLGPLLRAVWQRRRGGWWPYLDTALDLTTPPFVLLAAGTAAMTVIHALLWLAAGGPGWPASLWAALLAGQAVYVFTGCAVARAPWRAYAALFLYGPLYAAAKVRYCLTIARGETVGWIPTARRPAASSTRRQHEPRPSPPTHSRRGRSPA
jgi:cellulose synthase/poly-beta-1,6-N-acetylglucosamine synthase-like glycosyltransferase